MEKQVTAVALRQTLAAAAALGEAAGESWAAVTEDALQQVVPDERLRHGLAEEADSCADEHGHEERHERRG